MVTKEVINDLLMCEAVIQQGLSSFVEVGKSLAKIRNLKLYRNDYSTFEQYCVERWGMARPYAYQVIAASEVVNNLSANADSFPALPQTESQARPLTKLKNPDDQRAVWDRITQSYPAQSLTAAIIEDEVGRYHHQKRENEGVKHQNRQEKTAPEWAGEWGEPSPLFQPSDVEGINQVLNLLSSHRWIYELGFRRSDPEGYGGRLYDPEFGKVFDRLGGNWGVRLLGMLIRADIGWTEFGPGMIRAIVRSDFFSILETGINTAYQLEDVKEVVGIQGRDSFIGYFGLGSKSVLQLETDVLRIFYQLRAVEDRYYNK